MVGKLTKWLTRRIETDSPVMSCIAKEHLTILNAYTGGAIHKCNNNIKNSGYLISISQNDLDFFFEFVTKRKGWEIQKSRIKICNPKLSVIWGLFQNIFILYCCSKVREPLWQCWATPGQIFAAWHLGITCHERHVWHMTPCEPSQHKYRARTWPESHFRGNLRWQMPLSSLSVNIGPWDWVLDPWCGQWRWLVEIWSGSWQHWHHYCLLKVYNTNKTGQ